MSNHQSGFVNIIGHPNVGKSTLMNALVGERMCIINRKPQTTRHRIIGILSDDNYQVVFSDTPGLIEKPAYEMQSAMNSYAYSAFEDSDIMLLVIDCNDDAPFDGKILNKIQKLTTPKILVLNKIDLIDEDQIKDVEEGWTSFLEFETIHRISALQQTGTNELLKSIIQKLPEGPPYYPKDQLTDRPERFFVSEIIREKILEIYHQEIPYSAEVIIESFKEKESKSGPIIHINANIYVARKTQKSIVIGKGGASIKQLGISSRKSIETFLDQRVHLELYVRVKENWRNDERQLKHFGYH